MKEKHICYYCGQQANYQLKNGNWCCKQNVRSCPSIIAKVSKKAKEKWNELKQEGITKRKDIPQEKRKTNKGTGVEGICYYCGKSAQYQLKNGRWCCCQSVNSCSQMRKKNSEKRKQQIKDNPEYLNNNLKKYNKIGHKAWNKGLTKETDERIKKASEKFHERFEKGEIKIKGHPHSKETKEKLSKIRSKYLDSCQAGFQDVKWYKIKNINDDEYVVRGTWQLNVAKKLNELNILWIKNKRLSYLLQDIKRNYNPDFYLPNINEYIQVKGYFSSKDKNKMNSIVQQYPKIKIRFILEQIYQKFINDEIDFKNIPLYKF